MLSRQACDRNMEMHNGNWKKTSQKCREIRGKVLGIIGYGHVGSQLGILAEVNILYNLTYIRHVE